MTLRAVFVCFMVFLSPSHRNFIVATAASTTKGITQANIDEGDYAQTGNAQAGNSSGGSVLGVYDFLAGESTPVIFNGELLMMESIAFCYPWHMRLWKPDLYDGNKCPSYLRVRSMSTGVVITNITQSCNHTFAAAHVEHDQNTGKDTLYLFAVRCARYMASQSWCESPYRADPVCPCWYKNGNVSECAVDVFYSSDPALHVWTTKATVFPGKRVANVDVTSIPDSVTFPNYPDIKYLMIYESGDLLGTNNSTPDMGWYRLGATATIKACPSFRVSAVDGFLYVLGGGDGIEIARSKDLVNWETQSNIITCGGAGDRKIVDHTGIFKWVPPSPGAPTPYNFTSFIEETSWDHDASDIDLTTYKDESTGQDVTLFQYLCGNQRNSAFQMLKSFPGTVEEVLPSFFPAPPV